MSKPLENKCDLCGLKVLYPFHSTGASISSDEAFDKLHALKRAGIISPAPSRVVAASTIPDNFGSTAFCAVASKAWHRNDKKCRHWKLRIEGASVSDYLSLHHDRHYHVIAIALSIVALVISVVSAIAQAISVYSPSI